MIIFLIIFCLLLVIYSIAVTMKLLQLTGRVIDLEDIVGEEQNALEKIRVILTRVHSEIDKVSKYPVLSGEPIIVKLVNTVKKSKDDVARLLDNLAGEPDDNTTDNTTNSTTSS